MMNNLDGLRISWYENEGGWPPHYNLAMHYTGKVQVADRRKHYEPPSKLLPAEQTMPPACNCRGWMVSNGCAYACANVPAVMAECGLDWRDYPKLLCKVEPGYLERLAPYMTGSELCRGCLSNIRVRKAIG